MSNKNFSTKRNFLLSISVPATGLLMSACSLATEQPNVLLIIADDLGYKDLTCYGSTFYETPNLDQLASEGVKFTNGYASCPVCSPTRASLQTGKYPTKVNITDWIPGRAAYSDPSPRDRWLSAPLDDQLALEEVTIAEALKEKGYITFFAGKWHLGETEEFWPERQGYDINKGGWKKGAPNRNKDKGYNGFFSPYGNPRLEDGPIDEYLPERLAKETITFIENNKNEPFYACLSFYLVHTPLQAKQERIVKYKNKAKSLGLDTIQQIIKEEEWMKHASKRVSGYKNRIVQAHPIYGPMVEALDVNIGKVIDKLKELDLYDNTLIIFTSDNGGLSTSEGSPTSNLPLRGGKGWLYEGGIRVPFIVKHPGVQNQGYVNSMSVSSIDVFPTILSFAGLDVSKYDGIDGIDLRPYLETSEYPERPLFWHYPHYANQGGNPGSVVILGDYKLVHDFETGRKELYNLDSEVSEETDISSENKDKVTELYQKIDDWRKLTNALMMKPNPGWNGVEKIVE